MPRSASFDYARLLAAFGIVLFHAGAPGSAIGYAALPFFLIVMIVMSADSCQTLSWAAYSARRAYRLLGPWLVWSLIYAALKLAEVLLTSARLDTEFTLSMLLTGPALHLWFLPFACVACILLWPVMQTAKRTSALMALCCVVLALLSLGLRQTWDVQAPVAQWLYAAPAVALGLALALRRHSSRDCLMIVVGFVLVAWSAGWVSGLLQLGLAGAAFVVCQNVDVRVTSTSQYCAGGALGIYLAHPAVLSLLERGTPLVPETLEVAVLATLLSLVAVLLWKYSTNGRRGGAAAIVA